MPTYKLSKKELAAILAKAKPGERLYQVTVTMRFLTDEHDLERVADAVTAHTDRVYEGRRVRGRIEAGVIPMPGQEWWK